MSGEEDAADKPHEPSQKRLDDARKKGEVPRSADLAAAAGYGGILLAGAAFGAGSVREGGTALMVLLATPDTLAHLFLSDGGMTAAGGLMARLSFALAPWFALPALLVLVTFLAQRALIFAPSKLAPKLSRISPVQNFGNKFGRNGLFEFAKSLTKLVVFSIALGLFLKAELPDLLATIHLGPGIAAATLAGMAMRFLSVAFVVAVIIGAADLLWQRAEHMRRHRMSHKEMADEAKQAEGDPHMKQQRRQRAYDIATNRMMADVPKADVVIVNPEHYAVALKWSRARREAPVCVAKGIDEIAARIRETALTAGVPIHRDPPTARSIHATVEIGQQILREHYGPVAAAIRFAERMRHHRRGREE